MLKINTEKAPAAIGPYTQAICRGDVLYTSGQIGIDPATGALVPGGVREQAEQVMKNLLEVLRAGGSGADRVLKTTCFLKSMDDFAAFNEVYAKYFTSKPARSCVAVKTLPKNLLCEIEVIAAVEE